MNIRRRRINALALSVAAPRVLIELLRLSPSDRIGSFLSPRSSMFSIYPFICYYSSLSSHPCNGSLTFRLYLPSSSTLYRISPQIYRNFHLFLPPSSDDFSRDSKFFAFVNLSRRSVLPPPKKNEVTLIYSKLVINAPN